MSNEKAKPRRKREPGPNNHNIYRRYDGRWEVGVRDSTGKQTWPGPFDTISAARAHRDEVLGRKARGEVVRSNPRLRFGDAADALLAGPVAQLRATTQASYRNSVEVHLRPRWGRRRMDAMTPDDVAALVAELRAAGKAEWTIYTVLRAASRVFTHAQRRCGWHGVNPVPMLENGERAKPAETQRRRLFSSSELSATLVAAQDPYRLLFTTACVSGARLSELLGVTWGDVDLRDRDAAEVRLAFQVDRAGLRTALKTEESRRTVELPRQLAGLLLEHRAAAAYSTDEAFVFCTRSGRALGQRNVLRELRRAMANATDEGGRPAFPILTARDADGRPVKVPRGAVPNFHSFRHTAASEAIAAGESVEEVSWQLGHRNSNVTRTVYVQEVKSAERTARRRTKMEERLGNLLRVADDRTNRQPSPFAVADVVELPAARATAR
jgi:integrase